MISIRTVILTLCLWYSLLAQTAPAGSNVTRGACSPAVSGNNNTFTINCQGLTKEQSADFLAVLKKLTNNSLDSKVVMAMLDELVSNTRELKTGVNEIRKQQEGRRLSAEAAAILVESLRKVEPKELIVVRLFNGTAESIAFGESIETAFKVAGWRSRISTATAVSNGILNGQEIAVGKPDNQAAVQVQRIFKTLGVELGGKLEKQITDNTIEIYIYPVP